jgi:hypothetical protein
MGNCFVPYGEAKRNESISTTPQHNPDAARTDEGRTVFTPYSVVVFPRLLEWVKS